MIERDTVELWFLRPERPNWLQRLILWRSYGTVTHVELVIGQEMYSAVAGEGGVRMRPVGTVDPDDYIRVQVSLPLGGASAAREWLRRHLGAVYDARGLIEIVAGRASSDDRAWYCSELCAAALHAAGIWQWLDAHRSTPEQLLTAALSRAEAMGDA